MRVYKRKVTEKRLAANRAAAAQSTGPRTEDGKRRSAFNSFQHGLYATQAATQVLPGVLFESFCAWRAFSCG
ncbi:MAG: hypothetical protein ACRD3O_04140 [Terriglobia bacterium]